MLVLVEVPSAAHTERIAVEPLAAQITREPLAVKSSGGMTRTMSPAVMVALTASTVTHAKRRGA
jgi:hypothetical protein